MTSKYQLDLTVVVPSDVAVYDWVAAGEIVSVLPIVERVFTPRLKPVAAWSNAEAHFGTFDEIIHDNGFLCDVCFHVFNSDFGCPCNHDGCAMCYHEEMRLEAAEEAKQGPCIHCGERTDDMECDDCFRYGPPLVEVSK